MADFYKDLQLSHEIKKSFLDYAMSVIVSRALPDVKDGLKPVQRRIVYGMNELGAVASSPHKKSARITGDVMGKYHPHGDSSIYDALVRMAQDFSYRYMLVDGHGNFGSIDGDGAAAQRYTEARMSKLSMELVRDMNKNTVDFTQNYDGEEKEPTVLPARFPNLLVNGSTGIAVGMATNIPPHNLGEVIDGTVALLDNPEIDIDGLMEYIKGPDFPTGATILGNAGIKKGYETGRGIVTIRSKAEIHEMDNGKHQIIVTEIPYMVNKANLVTKIADLVRNKNIDGITDLRDESSMKGIKIVIEVRRDANANVILNQLYKQTSLQQTFGINSIALVDGEPRTLSIKEMLEKYIEHQKIVIIRRTRFDLEKAEAREHILHGLAIALDNIDAIVKMLKESPDDETATKNLINTFNLTEIQAKAILEMKLRRLTGLERDKINQELEELKNLIIELNSILQDDQKVINIIKTELLEIKDKYGDERRTNIDMSSIDYIEDESLIPEENILITLTNKGYIKRVVNDTFKTQNRGGVGIKGITTNEEDFPEKIMSMNTHDFVLLFSNYGKVYRIKGYEIPEFSRQSKGLPIINLLPIEKEEKITSSIMIKAEEEESKYLIFVTKDGLIKRTDLSEFDSIRKNGKIAILLKEGDELIAVRKSDGSKEVAVAASNGRMVRFDENEVRVMGRNSSGVKAINFEDDKVIGAEVVDAESEILVITENGYGKRTTVDEYRLTHRGSKGVKALNITEKNGKLVSMKCVYGDEDIVIITDLGMLIRISTDGISKLGRTTQGVKLINLKEDQKVSTVTTISKEEENNEETTEEIVEELENSEEII